MRVKKYFVIVLVLVTISLLFAGCDGEQGTATQTGDSASENSSQFVWKLQTIHGANQLEFDLYKQIAEDIYKASNGRLKVDVYPNGTFASSTEGFNACMNGVVDVIASYPSWMKGIEYSFQVMTTGNMQMEATDKWVWIKEFGGHELMQKAFDKVNLKLVTYQLDGTEVLMAREPFKEITELEGKKFRTSDPRLLEENGVAAITLPLEELFTAFSTGAVDAAEFGYLAYNKALGLTDVANYAIYPDFWNCHNSIAIAVNKDSWDQLYLA